ncbi:acyl-CoA-binding protein [Violaceomyces palustris]|uniref:Acyl-CoA-binding protein n=1 Tax=Violaceomyces palustris TaxID=1673888 RepID=A0ACD0P2X1_9BASI|nr:acyl-CoA-binding protein [Violaceomyces palustris]
MSFAKAVEIVQGMPSDGEVQPSQDDKLKFYGLYKQATVGDVNTSRPGLFDLAGKYKWDAWNSNKGLSKEEAEQKYVEALIAILEKHSDNEDAKKWLEQLKSA